MDLVADMLVSQLQQNYSHLFDVTRVCPPLRRRFSRDGDESSRFNADRFLNRFRDYPRFLNGIKDQFDLFHIVDHSYGQLLHELPPERTIVTCHDLDTFQCLLDPVNDPRSLPFRKMMARTLSGFRKAERVTCDSQATRNELLRHKLVEPDRAVVVPNGIHPSCSLEANPTADREAAKLLGAPTADAIDMLHVGSTIRRKRIDLLLEIFAAVRKALPQSRLIRVGGEFTDQQSRLAETLGLTQAIVVLSNLERDVLAAVYRRAAVVLLPSEREGFGLPIVEALACGTPVIASDLPVLRETGGQAVEYCPIAQVDRWLEKIVNVTREKSEPTGAWMARRRAGIAQANKFSWAHYAAQMASLYQDVLTNI